ncbi:MAG: glycosyltransferase family 4 protein [Algoriphagus sp.]|nr:glycosyltransferase family 4 protein [Algoriphagus sp.]
MNNKKKKVLLFIDWFLPGNKAGGPVTSNVNMVEQLRSESDFFILTRNTDYCEEKAYESIPPNQWTQFKEGVSIFYFSNEFLTISNLRKVALEVKCDHWYINGIYSKYFSILPLFLSRFNKDMRTTVSARGMLSPHALAVKPLKKKILLGVFKTMGFYRNVGFHATNETEAVEIARQVGRNKGIQVAPNLSKSVVSEKPKETNKITGVLKLISLARISPEKNTLGALEILSGCLNHSIQIDFYGQPYDLNYQNECEEIVRSLPKNIRVIFHGSISPDLIPVVLQKTHFLFLPTRGENFGHSILESLLSGCPAIISDQTPWKDLEEKGIGWDIPLSEPEKFIQAIETAAAMDQETYNKMSQAAFEFARDFTSNPEVLEANRRLFGI